MAVGWRRKGAWGWAATVVLLWSATAEAKLSIEDALNLSRRTGRPIFAVAGDAG